MLLCISISSGLSTVAKFVNKEDSHSSVKVYSFYLFS